MKEIRLPEVQVKVSNQQIIEMAYLTMETIKMAKGHFLNVEQSNSHAACYETIKELLKSVDQDYLAEHQKIKEFFADGDNQKIKVELVETNCHTRWPCDVCGGHTEKVSILAEVASGPYKDFLVCEQCLESRDFDEKLNARADRMERCAAELRKVVGRLEVPSFEDWKAACDKYDEVWAARTEQWRKERENDPDSGNEGNLTKHW